MHIFLVKAIDCVNDLNTLNPQGFNYVTYEWILHESGHKFFMKALQILYAFVLLNMGWESQTAVLARLEAGKHFIFV